MNEELAEELKAQIKRFIKKKDICASNEKFWETKRREYDSKIKSLDESHSAVTGEYFLKPADNRSTAAIVEEILRENGELHVDKILELAQQKMSGRKLEKQSLVATLVRYVQQNRRFRRADRPNTFGLIEK